MIPAIITIGVFILVYWLIVRPRLLVYRHVAGEQDKIDSGSAKGQDWFWAKISGYKTAIFAGLAGITPAIPALLDQLHMFDKWSAFVEQSVANKISAGLALLAMITHATGIESAAKAIPKE